MCVKTDWHGPVSADFLYLGMVPPPADLENCGFIKFFHWSCDGGSVLTNQGDYACVLDLLYTQIPIII